MAGSRIELIEPDWPAPSGVVAFSTTRSGGVSTGCYESLNLAMHVGDEAAMLALLMACFRGWRNLRDEKLLPEATESALQRR